MESTLHPVVRTLGAALAATLVAAAAFSLRGRIAEADVVAMGAAGIAGGTLFMCALTLFWERGARRETPRNAAEALVPATEIGVELRYTMHRAAGVAIPLPVLPAQTAAELESASGAAQLVTLSG